MEAGWMIEVKIKADPVDIVIIQIYESRTTNHEPRITKRKK